MLFPIQNRYRYTHSLDGLWDFQLDPKDIGISQSWMNQPPTCRQIAVPGSWNEQFTDTRDYLDTAWYFCTFYRPKGWEAYDTILRFGSVNYTATCWLDGTQLGHHEGGHLPFHFDISAHLHEGQHLLAVRVENRLHPERVPPGNVGGWQAGAGTAMFPDANFDFFPYCGIHREVTLCALPTSRILDISTQTTLLPSGHVHYKVQLQTHKHINTIQATLNGEESHSLHHSETHTDKHTTHWTFEETFESIRLWSPDDPYLHTLTLLAQTNEETCDQYSLSVGLRSVEVKDQQLLLNGDPIELRGFGKHEDFTVTGRGLHLPLLIKDNALLKWVGANSYRTAHYPYSEHALSTADREGFLIIDEIPAVGLFFDDGEDAILTRHRQCERQLKDLIQRDKNHPSVIMWSVANEPCPPTLFKDFASLEQAQEAALEQGTTTKEDIPSLATDCLRSLVEQSKALDPTRPVTMVSLLGGPKAWLGLGDVVCINRYWGWYVKPGQLKEGIALLEKELDTLYTETNKPIMLTEFGADTIAGCHRHPAEMFSEEYQVEMLEQYLDLADKKPYVIGMHIWNFADFKTGQAVLRMGGLNHKGVFTRDRQPKMAAHMLHKRWHRANH
ncbi:MAG TPA: beta-galactosidase [Myxococcales bacterium]|nr:beta-galactosidase [Deltaproteobacteria bacterium]MBU52479.1 beta-galactosidase [Deltaproteobacteria bacterium]HAA54265.1 beta-galactosidase [Myxococcales bacterium]|tara:strand:- start:26836 stop:28677 length:1842 start_codon:yes stop_codon:yes gene_type:complete